MIIYVHRYRRISILSSSHNSPQASAIWRVVCFTVVSLTVNINAVLKDAMRRVTEQQDRKHRGLRYPHPCNAPWQACASLTWINLQKRWVQHQHVGSRSRLWVDLACLIWSYERLGNAGLVAIQRSMETITTSSGQIILCRAKPVQILNRIHNLLSTRLFHGDADLLTACYNWKSRKQKALSSPSAHANSECLQFVQLATYNNRFFLPAESALDWKKTQAFSASLYLIGVPTRKKVQVQPCSM